MMLISFGITDYILFIITLISFMAIGIYFGFFGSKQKSAREYLYGTRDFKFLQVGLSLSSSTVTAISMIGTLSEVYIFGSQFIMVSLGALLGSFLINIIILPIFSGSLQLKTPYEYYELRFHKSLRLILTIFYLFRIALIMPLVLYVCCLILSEAIPLPISLCTTVTGAICIFYTLVGGYSSVIWTDVLQAVVMLATLISIMILGIKRAGGVQEVWAKVDEGQRLNFFNWDPNPFTRLSFWSVTIGMCFSHTAYMGCSPSALQRYMSLRTEKEARKSVFMGSFAVMLVMTIGGITGLSMYANYAGCDPVKNKTMANYNQLTVHFILDTIKNIPGMIGLCVAGTVSAGLSTLSAEANTVSGVIYYDFIYKKFKNLRSDTKGAVIMKIIVFFFGVYCLNMAPVMSKVKYLMQAAISGTLFGFLFVSWVAIGATYYDVADFDKLPMSTENCTNDPINFTLSSHETNTYLNRTFLDNSKPEPFFMYKLSFTFYTLFGCIISILMAHVSTFIFRVNDVKNMDPNLFLPFVRQKTFHQKQELQAMFEKREDN